MAWKRTLAAIGVIAMAAILTACSGASPAGGAKKQVIGFSQANGSDEWRTNQNKKVAENCNPVAQTLVSDALGDDAVQSSHVDEFVSRPVNVLLLTPNTAAGLTEAAKRALDKKVPVITLDRSVDVEVTQHIGADNKLIGKTAAEYVSKTILGGAGGKVIEIQGTAGASATTDRHDEFINWLQANDPKVEIVDSVVADYKRENALTAMNDLLQKYGPNEVQVIYTHNDAMALGAVAALETANRLAEFKVVGIDGQNEAIQAIKDGKIVVTFTYDNAGKEACETAAKLLKGETVDKQWVLPTNTIDAANVDEFLGKGF
ncbi:MAG TPA: substrate-binding domain-containing protein [Candidatus Limnocylindrales bacterium]|jgi:ribose transport system substrate-binding protein|nr:substrate-binding domain-containing protein [Candidatus Limnocylindrales bacterium]